MVSKLKKELDYQQNSIEKMQQEMFNKLSIFPKLKKETAKEYVQELNKIEKYLSSLPKQKFKDKNDTNLTRTFVPYLIKEIESTKSSLAFKTIGNTFSDKETFELQLKADGLSVKEVADPLKRYHELAEFTVLSQITSEGVKDAFIGARTIEDYTRTCNTVIAFLDRAASDLFNTQINTPANFDVKINDPHHFLGQINIGYENTLLSLYRTISHEGPFGHNTHKILSKDSDFRGGYRHTSEGIAILGEWLGSKAAFPEHKDSLLLIHYSMNRNRMDAFGAAIEKLTFYDGKTPDQIVNLLDSEIIPKSELKKMHFYTNRTKNVSSGSFQYYAGAHLVGKAYEKGNKATQSNKKQFNNLLKVIYTGNRPANVLTEEVNIFIENLKK